jgi:1-acyl-sn-glycerol-3-phosphate acyltransferase
VFSSRERRFSSLCFATIRVPQSVDVSSQDAVMSARDVARAARRAIECAHARLAAGDALLIFPEGTRSRTGAMTPLLPAVARYLEVAGAVVLPVALTGPDRMFPVNDPVLRPAPVIMRIGAPLDASQLFANAQNDRERVMNVIGRAIATLLPAGYRGIYSADQS